MMRFSEISERPLSPVRVGVVACVVVACAFGFARIDEMLGLFDYRADRNASLTYRDRLYGEPFDIVGSQKVVEEARLWMPESSSYRVLVGQQKRVQSGVRRDLAPAFLEFLLMPREQTESPSAPWVFCYGCDRSELGAGFEVLSDGGNGIVFGRVR